MSAVTEHEDQQIARANEFLHPPDAGESLYIGNPLTFTGSSRRNVLAHVWRIGQAGYSELGQTTVLG
jgi:hypothetical protein